MKIGIIGLGNLGLNLLLCFAEQQYEIYIDEIDKVINIVNQYV